MINIKIEHRCTGQKNLDHDYTAYSKLYILEGGDYFECDGDQPRSIIYRPYVKDNISPYITMHGDFIPSAGGLYTTNDEEELNIVFNVNYDGYTPPPSGGGPEDPGDNDSSAKKPISFSFTVKSYKSGTLTEVDDDFVVEKCYYLYREDEGTVGDWGYLNLNYYTNYEFDGKKYIYTEPQTHTLHSIKGYKLSGFFGLENGYSLTGEKEGINNYTFEAYYVDNNFKVIIDSKGIDRSQVVVQNPNFTNIKYELPYEYNYPNTTLLLEALTSNDDYVFDYWEVNGEKYSTNSILDYEITQDTIIYCYFKEKPSMVEGKIATNEDIYNASKYIYGANNNQCPTKEFIINNGYDIVKFNNEYQDNQCVVLDDMSFKRTIEFKFENKVNSWVDPFAIWFGVKSKQISTYKFANQISKDYTSEITIAADISVWGDYKDEYLYVGFWSDGWNGDGRIMTFVINNKSFSNEKEGFSAEIPTTIKVVDFLRYYYKDIKVHLSAN